MFDSVRVRLTFWHVGILAFLLVAFSASVYVILRQNFYESEDGILKSVGSATVSILGKELSESGLAELAARDAVKTLNFPDHTLAIFDSNGDLLAEKPVGSSDRIPLPAADVLRDGRTHLYTVSALGGEGELRRVAAIRVTPEPIGEAYTVITSRSLTPLLGELENDRRDLAIAVPVGLLLAGLSGWFLSRKTLAPVLAMARQAHRIGAENLDQRLPVVNARDELGRLASTFNGLLSRLSTAFLFQRQFMADASHQLKTPLAVIRMAASVTLEKDHRSDEEYRSALATVHDQSIRLTRIVEEMFLLARADSGRLAAGNDSFYLDELLSETVRVAKVLATPLGVAVRIPELPESPCTGDEELLRQMFMNLVDNALKHTPAGGAVTLDLKRAAGKYRVSVIDTGTGIPLEEQSRVFERFFQGRNIQRAHVRPSTGAGSGLGLSIARTIAEAHGGSLILEDSDSGGTTFSVVLPGPESLI